MLGWGNSPCTEWERAESFLFSTELYEEARNSQFISTCSSIASNLVLKSFCFSLAKATWWARSFTEVSLCFARKKMTAAVRSLFDSSTSFVWS